MTEERIPRWLDDLERALAAAEDLVRRGRTAYDTDPAIPLAFEALSIRVGEIAKRLVAADDVTFAAGIWSDAAQHRDFVAHHYDRIDREVLWQTVVRAFPLVREELGRIRDV